MNEQLKTNYGSVTVGDNLGRVEITIDHYSSVEWTVVTPNMARDLAALLHAAADRVEAITPT